MDDLPQVPFLWIETTLLGLGVTALLAIHLWHLIRSQVSKRQCVGCGELIAPQEYAHHLELCYLRKQQEQSQNERRIEILIVVESRIHPRRATVDTAPKSSAKTHSRIAPGDGESPRLTTVSGRPQRHLQTGGGRTRRPIGPMNLNIKRLDRKAVRCEARHCDAAASYLLSVRAPQTFVVAYCAVHAAQFLRQQMNSAARLLRTSGQSEAP
jgi:hypothetical protein